MLDHQFFVSRNGQKIMSIMSTHKPDEDDTAQKSARSGSADVLLSADFFIFFFYFFLMYISQCVTQDVVCTQQMYAIARFAGSERSV